MIDGIEEYKGEAREQDLQDQLHEQKMRSDFDYFLEHSKYQELKEAYDELNLKMTEFGWLDDLKGWL